MKDKKRLLIVGMAHSIHVARWISQINPDDWDVHLFPSIDLGLVDVNFRDVVVHHSVFGHRPNQSHRVKLKGIPVYSTLLSDGLRFLLRQFWPNYRLWQLKRVIKKFRPDVIHSMEIQYAGYMVTEAKKQTNGHFPKWIVTNWGSDIFLFGQTDKHNAKIRETLSLCDYYSCECHRDVGLARDFGFKGTVSPVYPNSGGFDLSSLTSLKQSGLTSNRKTIVLKGYQGVAGRALFALKALEKCIGVLNGYKIVIYSSIEESGVPIAAELFSKRYNIPVELVTPGVSHKEILKLHGHARVSIGLSISDGLSTSFVEALMMGSFPIQSWTACADEWITDGKTGILVPPDDCDAVAAAIKIALTDDQLVNSAAKINCITAKERLDKERLKPKIAEFYQIVIDGDAMIHKRDKK